MRALLGSTYRQTRKYQYYGNVGDKTNLLLNVRDLKSNKLMSEHCWIYGMKNFPAGSVVKFSAITRKYKRNYYGTNDEDRYDYEFSQISEIGVFHRISKSLLTNCHKRDFLGSHYLLGIIEESKIRILDKYSKSYKYMRYQLHEVQSHHLSKVILMSLHVINNNLYMCIYNYRKKR